MVQDVPLVWLLHCVSIIEIVIIVMVWRYREAIVDLLRLHYMRLRCTLCLIKPKG